MVKDILAKNNVTTLEHHPYLLDVIAADFLPVPSNVNNIKGMPLTQLRMRLKSCKGFHKVVSRNFSNTFPIAGRRVYLHKADHFE